MKLSIVQSCANCTEATFTTAAKQLLQKTVWKGIEVTTYKSKHTNPIRLVFELVRNRANATYAS